ncbi:MAG: hypothetical protein AAF226_01270, partial [Verrucomicrobiota bacterium]
MQDNDKDEDRKKNPNGNDGSFNWKGLVFLTIALGLFALALWSRGLDHAKSVNYEKFTELVQSEKIIIDAEAKQPKVLSIEQRDGSAKEFIKGWYEPDTPDKEGNLTPVPFETPIILDYMGDDLKALLADHGLKISSLPTSNDGMGAMLLSFYLPLLLLVILLAVFFRHQLKMAGRGAMSFGKSKAKLMAMDKNKVTFKNVAGVEEAKEEVWEIVEYLRD